LAQEELAARGVREPKVAAPMMKSAVARNLKTKQELEKSKVRAKGVDNTPQRIPTPMSAKTRRLHWEQIVNAAEEVATLLEEMLEKDEEVFVREGEVRGRSESEVVKELLDQARLAKEQLEEGIGGMRGEHLGKQVNSIKIFNG
jgi:protein phosphatase 1 regulatory subunit 37